MSRKFHLSIKSRFDAAHFLTGFKGAEASMHGHTWRVEVLFVVRKLDSIGMVPDILALRKELDKVLGSIDHGCINSVLQGPSGDPEKNPTVGNVARWIFTNLADRVKDYSVEVQTVIVSDSDDSWVSFSE